MSNANDTTKQCCPRDHDLDGNCDRHPPRRYIRGKDIDMITREEVQELIRVEMRAFRRALWELNTTSNHDAHLAVERVRAAIDKQFPQSHAEYAREISEHTIDSAVVCYGSDELDYIGKRLGLSRPSDESDDGYVRLLKAHRNALIGD